MNLYTSDLHLGHANVIKHDNRPFHDVEEMDKTLIELWNARVSKDDHVYIVGDLIFRSDKDPVWYLDKLKGHKHLIIGNHDEKLLKHEKAIEAIDYFDSIDKIKDINDDGKRIVLCHYPMIEWNAYYHGSWHIYGHIHNRRNEAYEPMKKKDHALNAGCMINNYMPVSFEELIRNNEIFKNAEDERMERVGE